MDGGGGGALQCHRLHGLRRDRLVCSGGGGRCSVGDKVQVAVGRVMVMMVDNTLLDCSAAVAGGASSNSQLMMIVLRYHGG